MGPTLSLRCTTTIACSPAESRSKLAAPLLQPAPDSATGNILDFTYNFVDGSAHNNGNVAAITNNRYASARSQSFTYDALNRLATAKLA
jgi:hypothetical protein